MKSVIKVFLVLLLSVLIFTTCENSIGLGPKVNTEKPVIKTPEDDKNGPGAFLQGKGNKIWLEVEQEFGVARVFMEVEYIDINSKEKTRKTIEAHYDESKKQWYVDLDTSDMEDGSIKAWVTAIDVDGNKSTTTDIVYFVKNLPPQIKINMPLVDDTNWDDDVFLDDLKYSDPLFLGFELMGLATDNYGIEEGYPKIMIWPADYPYVDSDGIPFEDDGLYGTWRSLVVPNAKSGLTATKFSWPMMILVPDADAPGGYRLPRKDEPNNSLNQGIYRIRILTKDLFENDNYYPNRKDNKRGPDGQAMNWEEIPRKYIEINYKASDVPIVQVTDGPQYSNTEKDFELYFSVSSQNAVDFTEAYIVDGNSGYEKIIGGPYTPDFIDWNGALYRYKLTITSAQAKAWTNIPEKGLIYARLRGAAGEKTGPNAYHNFIYDIDPPEVIIDRPVSLIVKDYGILSGTLNGGSYTIIYPDRSKPKWVTGTITFGGTAKDAYPLKEVYYHIGKLNEDKVSEAERASILSNPDNWTNTNLHLNAPIAGWSGSPYSWTYTFSPFDKAYKDTPENIIEWPVQEYSELINGSIENNNYTFTIGKSRFYLPFYVKVTDSADNYRIIHYKLCVDPELDEPLITITQPERKKDPSGIPIQGEAGIPIVGGTVRVAGFAEDNFWMHTVLVRVQRIGTPGYYIPNTTPPISKFYTNNPGYPKPKKGDGTDDTDGWFKAEKIGDSNNVNWYANINQDRALDPSDEGETQDVTVEVIAIDCDEADSSHNTHHIVGPIEKLDLKFSRDVPMITETKIIKDNVAVRNYTEGMKVSGVFKFTFTVDAIKDINTLTARVNGAAIPITLINGTNPEAVDPNYWDVGLKTTTGKKAKRTITVTINSTTDPIPGLGVTAKGYPYGKTGEIILEIMAEDATDNHLTTTNTFILGIDNFYPTATAITTYNVASDNPDPDPIKAKYFYVSGHVKDYADETTGKVQALERVLVYFEKADIINANIRTVTGNTNYIKLDGTQSVDASDDFGFYPSVLDKTKVGAGSSPNDFNFYRFPKIKYENTIPPDDTGTWAWTSKIALVIDYQEGGGTVDIDNDGTQGETWNGQLADRDFAARVDFTGWKDGPYIVHYLVMDQAGNATHYTSDIYLENNKPRISKINFGTDIDGTGLADNDNEFLYGAAGDLVYPPDSSDRAGIREIPFRIRGNHFMVKFDVAGGNGNNLKASVTYVTSGVIVNANTMKKGYVYTIVDLVTGPAGSVMTDFTKFGAPNNTASTTFVAAGPATGTGTVIQYVDVNRTGNGLGTKNTNCIVTIEPDEFGDSPLKIPDSTKDGSGDIINKNDRFFVVKVWDDTINYAGTGGTPSPEYDNLADVMLVKLNIDNEDEKNPTINISPFGREWTIPVGANPANDESKVEQPVTEYNKNIITSGSGNKLKKEGYVQYAIHNEPADNVANISGKVIFLGKADDNQRISAIYATINGYNGGAGLGTIFKIANVVGGKISPITPTGTYAGQWSLKVVDDYPSLEFGHALNWEFMWDSSKHSTITANNVDVTFTVEDAASRTGDSLITVNVVPYISEVITPLSGAYTASPSAFNRSAMGGYPVRENEQITINGFNLGNSVTNAKISGTSLPTDKPTGSATADPTPSCTTTSGITTIVSYVPAGVSSGELVVTVNGIDSFNNKSNKKTTGDFFGTTYTFTAPYNWEPNGVNNNVLNNSRYIYVWQAGIIDNSVSVSTMYNPFMRVMANGTRLLSYGYYPSSGNGVLRVMRNNTDIATATANTNRMTNTTIAVPSAYTGTTVGSTWYAIGSDITAGNYPLRFARSNVVGGGYDATTNLVAAIGSNSNRFKIPRIAVQSTAATRADSNCDRILISYYDGDSNQVNVIYGTAGANGNVSNISATAQVIAATDNTTSKGSMYTAVGFLSNGLPLLAYYDRINDNLVFSWGTGTPTSTTYNNAGARVTPTQTDWQNADRRKVIDNKKGAHVDMAVDANDNVHLAYFDLNNGGLYYALIPYTGTTVANRRPDTANVVPVKVDTFLSAGTKIMINVRSDGTRPVPYITYAHSSFQGTRNSIRVAWRTDFNTDQPLAGADGSDAFSGKWEVMTVPVSKGATPQVDEFVCNGVPTATTWTEPGTTGDYLQYNTNLNQTVIVGYMTDKWYEGAILMGKILSVPPPLQK